MLSRVRFDDKDDTVSEGKEVSIDFFESPYVTARVGRTPTLNKLHEGEHDMDWL